MTAPARRILRAVVVLSLVAAALLAPATVAGPSGGTARAADLSAFDPGNIISDAVFWDSASMDAATVQSFLNAKGASCAPASDGTACLKNYRVDTTTRAGDSLCGDYQAAPRETAAVIITRVALACRTNPRVLLVLLQKEQGLVTGAPTAKKYERAAGYACPDNGTGACDPAYAGLENQLYWAARQYRRYAASPTSYSYRAGQYNQIAWSPTASCGKSSVFIVNQATAGLYNYTPYRPNAAALAAGYGSGDACSSYGNRNFYNYFTDWFGSTGFRVFGAIDAYYIGHGGGTGSLGAPVAEAVCGLRDGGCRQDFTNGRVYWSPATGTSFTFGAIAAAWRAAGAEGGGLGYPVADQFCGLVGGGCAQFFQGGGVYWSPATGAHLVFGAIGAFWFAQGYEVGPLGYPVAEAVCGLGGGCGQAFQNGSIFWGPSSGTHATSGPIGALYTAQGGPAGALGLPSDDAACGLAAGGCRQHFTTGTIAWTSATGAHALTSGTAALWLALGQEGGGLGYPVEDERCGLTAGGCSQAFQGGAVARSATGSPHSLFGAIGAEWQRAGADAGPLGYPVAEATCSTAGCSQVFERGALTWTGAAGVRMLTGGIALLWDGQGGGSGPLGYATGDVSCGLTAGGCSQAFTGGTAYWSPATLEHAVRGGIADAYARIGAQDGYLGYPTGEAACTSADACSQPFQQGWLAGAGATGVHPVTGGFAFFWTAWGGASSWLGYPVADAVCAPTGACSQQFQNGWFSWTAASGVHALSGAIGWTWAAGGGVGGPLGAATGDVVCGLTGGGCTQQFQAGTFTWSPASGAHAVTGGIAFTWTTVLGGDRSSIGYPTGEVACVANGCGQPFQRGALTWTPAEGVHMISGAVADYWSAQGGTAGRLGQASSDVDCTTQPAGGCLQRFQNGTVTWQATAGTHAVSGALLTSWAGQGGARGSLGYPTGEATSTAGGLTQSFQGGALTWDSTTGAVTRS